MLQHCCENCRRSERKSAAGCHKYRNTAVLQILGIQKIVTVTTLDSIYPVNLQSRNLQLKLSRNASGAIKVTAFASAICAHALDHQEPSDGPLSTKLGLLVIILERHPSLPWLTIALMTSCLFQAPSIAPPRYIRLRVVLTVKVFSSG